MARKPKSSRRPKKAGIKAAADRAEKRTKGERLDEPRVAIDPEIERVEATGFESFAEIIRVPSRAGRPSPYKPEYCQEGAEAAINGETDEEIADRFDIDVRTLYRWKAKRPEFRQSLAWGKSHCDERVERSLYARAVGYTYDAVKIMQNEGKPIVVAYKEHVAPDVGAAKMWLTNRKRKEWTEVQRFEHGRPGDFDAMSDDELREYIRQETAALLASDKSGKKLLAKG